MSRTKPSVWGLGTIPVLTLVLGVSGCGSSGSSVSSQGLSTSAPTSAAVSGGTSANALNALLPIDVRKRGSLTVASDASYAPMSYLDTDNKTMIGLDPDLGHAIGKKLGITFNFTNVTFDGIIPGLTSGRYDIAMSDMTDKRIREEQIDFVDYLNSSTGLLVRAGNPTKVSDLASLCGKSLALGKGTSSVDYVQPQVASCQKAGAPITVKLFPSATASKEAVASSRADAYMDDTVPLAYAAQTSPETFEVLPGAYASAPLGIGIPKKSTQLRDAILAAVKSMVADGTYGKILNKWGATNVSIGTPTINKPKF